VRVLTSLFASDSLLCIVTVQNSNNVNSSTETHPASAADLVRQLMLRAKPELAGSLENVLMGKKKDGIRLAPCLVHFVSSSVDKSLTPVTKFLTVVTH
jgi:hypothetical protein